MLLLDEQIKQFQMLYRKRFGKEISKKEAIEKGSQLVSLMAIVYRPMTITEYNKLKRRREATRNIQ